MNLRRELYTECPLASSFHTNDPRMPQNICILIIGQQVPRPDQNKPKPKIPHQPMPSSRYNELLRVIEELGKDVKPTYAGSKNAGERLRKGRFGSICIVM